jgi:hypothetical protein
MFVKNPRQENKALSLKPFLFSRNLIRDFTGFCYFSQQETAESAFQPSFDSTIAKQEHSQEVGYLPAAATYHVLQNVVCSSLICCLVRAFVRQPVCPVSIR